jgi:hypothetical protein
LNSHPVGMGQQSSILTHEVAKSTLEQKFAIEFVLCVNLLLLKFIIRRPIEGFLCFRRTCSEEVHVYHSMFQASRNQCYVFGRNLMQNY